MQRSSVKALPRGTRVESFEVRSVIGAGGFGITYLAFDHELEQAVALKEFCPARLAARSEDGTTVRAHSRGHERHFKSGRSAFLAEARALAKFRHPSIVRVSRHIEQFDTAYIVMDYEHGETLRARLRNGPVLSDVAAQQLFEPLLAGLGAVHRRNFMHGDIKPDNVILRKSGTPVLIDFGAARGDFSQEPAASYNTYTPGYAPPELHVHAQEIGPWSDVYSLGATLFHCLLGRAPPTAPERVFGRFFGFADPLEAELEMLLSTHSATTVETIMRALELKMADRLPSVEAFEACWAGRDASSYSAGDMLSSRKAASTPPVLTAHNFAPGPIITIEARIARLAQERLAEHIGVDSARRFTLAYQEECRSNEEYYQRLAAHIESDGKREEFMAAVMFGEHLH